ncbi:LysR family transcriptional regulator [Oxalobacteraceae bacterium CAVE-383]|nr:LysR family transcriptional regulator [Oxalobacteraceae bacterium CAVE-383]
MMIDRRIKFRHLLCFLAVAQQRSLQSAAATLSITQPAVSNTIKELEEILGVRLFERNRKGTVLTPQAEAFFPHAEACINSMQQAANSVGGATGASNPVIRIGAARALAASFVPQVLMAFRERVQNVQVNVLTFTTSDLMAQLREREFDFVLCRYSDPEQTVGLSFEYLYADPLVVVVRPGNPLQKSIAARTDKLRPITAILPLKTSINRPAVEALAAALGLGAITAFIETHSIFLGRTYTLKSDAIWFAPWSAVKDDVEAGVLIKLTPAAKGKSDSAGLMARSIGLLMRTNSVPTPEAQVLIDVIRACAAEHRTEVF